MMPTIEELAKLVEELNARVRKLEMPQTYGPIPKTDGPLPLRKPSEEKRYCTLAEHLALGGSREDFCERFRQEAAAGRCAEYPKGE